MKSVISLQETFFSIYFEHEKAKNIKKKKLEEFSISSRNGLKSPISKCPFKAIYVYVASCTRAWASYVLTLELHHLSYQVLHDLHFNKNCRLNFQFVFKAGEVEEVEDGTVPAELGQYISFLQIEQMLIKNNTVGCIMYALCVLMMFYYVIVDQKFTDLASGPAYDVRHFCKCLKAQQIPPRLPIIYLSAMQVYCVQ